MTLCCVFVIRANSKSQRCGGKHWQREQWKFQDPKLNIYAWMEHLHEGSMKMLSQRLLEFKEFKCLGSVIQTMKVRSKVMVKVEVQLYDLVSGTKCHSNLHDYIQRFPLDTAPVHSLAISTSGEHIQPCCDHGAGNYSQTTGPRGHGHLSLALGPSHYIKGDRCASKSPLWNFATVFAQSKNRYRSGRQMPPSND